MKWRAAIRGAVCSATSLPRNPLTNDTVKLLLPWMQVAREELAHGRAPLWNRYSFAGYPLLANSQSAPFSPLFLATLIVPLPKQIVAMAALKIFAALLFTYLFLKREKASDAAAVFGAIVFGFSTVMTLFLYYSAGSVVAFLPAAVFALLHAIDRQTKASIVFVALVIATLLANGHPESVLHIAVGCGAILLLDLALSCRSPRLAAARSRAIVWRRRRPRARRAGMGSRARTGAHQRALRHAAQRQRPSRCSRSPRRGPSSVRTDSAIRCGTTGRGRRTTSASPSRMRAFFRWRSRLRRCSFAGRKRRERWRIALAIVLFFVAMDWTIAGHVLNAIPPFNIAANDKLRFVCIFLIAIVAAKALDVSKIAMAIASAPIVLLAIYVYAKRSNLMRPIDLIGVAAILIFLFLPQRLRSWAAVVLVFAELAHSTAALTRLSTRSTFGRRCRSSMPCVRTRRASRSALPVWPGFSCRILPRSTARGCSWQRSDGLRVVRQLPAPFHRAGPRLASADQRRKPARAQLPERPLPVR